MAKVLSNWRVARDPLTGFFVHPKHWHYYEQEFARLKGHAVEFVVGDSSDSWLRSEVKSIVRRWQNNGVPDWFLLTAFTFLRYPASDRKTARALLKEVKIIRRAFARCPLIVARSPSERTKDISDVLCMLDFVESQSNRDLSNIPSKGNDLSIWREQAIAILSAISRRQKISRDILYRTIGLVIAPSLAAEMSNREAIRSAVKRASVKYGQRVTSWLSQV